MKFGKNECILYFQEDDFHGFQGKTNFKNLVVQSFNIYKRQCKIIFYQKIKVEKDLELAASIVLELVLQDGRPCPGNSKNHR